MTARLKVEAVFSESLLARDELGRVEGLRQAEKPGIEEKASSSHTS